MLAMTLGLDFVESFFLYKDWVKHSCNTTDCIHGRYPITINNFASLFCCTPAGRASDSMTAPA